MKIYLFTSLFIGTLLTAVTGQLLAQTNGAGTSDSSAANVVPGRLFDYNKINATGAVATVSGESLYKTATPNLTNTLYGKLPGLTVSQNTGEPGGDAASLGIRGISTYGVGTNGYNAMRYYIDGFEVNAHTINYLTPAELESVTVLKDAASLAAFGMRGSNGVVWIVTRRGAIGKSTVEFRIRSGLQSPTTLNKPLNGTDFANLYNQAISNDNGNVWTPKYATAQPAGTDFYQSVLRGHAPNSDGDLIFNGGDSTSRYNVVFDYGRQAGLYNVNTTDYASNETLTKYNLRTNLSFNMFKIFEARVDLGARLEDRKYPNYSTNQLFTDLASYPSNIYPIYDVNSTTGAVNGFSGTALYPNNPVGSISGLGWGSNHSKELQANLGLKETLDMITPGLYLDEAVSLNAYSVSNYNKTATYARYANGINPTTDKTTSIVASSLNTSQQQIWKQATVTLGYNRRFGDNHFTSAINYFQSDYREEGNFGNQFRYQNVAGNANYTYKNKYVGEFGFSYFGSDAYAPGNRWGFYPAVSAAWIASNESFLKTSAVFTFLKFRASVGKTGQSSSGATTLGSFSSGGRFLYQQYYASQNNQFGQQFYLGNGTASGQGNLNPLFIANSGVFADQDIKYNVGADLTLFKKLDVSVDVFMDKRTGILTQDNSIPGDFGSNVVYNNVGKMTNKGFEASATYNNKIGKVGYSISAMAAYAKNKIDYKAEVPPAYAYNGQTGRPFGTVIGLVANGLYQTTDFNTDGTLKSGVAVPAFGKVQAGDIKYQDLNNDGKIDQTDVTAIGNPVFPSLTYSFGANARYKGFDAGVFFQGTKGSTVNILYANSISNAASFGGTLNPQVVAFVNNGNAYPIAQGAYAYYPAQGIDTRATATYPRLTTTGNNNNYRQSSFWIKSGDFLRIRNAEIGYTVSSALLQKIKLSKLRIYVNAVNPITWSALLRDYKMDPETYSGYPALKSYNIGVTATF
jgi:TonB-linked SusC/RagA family outer membrane protein